MKRLYFESETSLTFSDAVVNHYFLLRAIPPSYSGQHIISSALTLSPQVPYTVHRDSFGNTNQTGCISFSHDAFTYTITGIAEIDSQKYIQEPLNPIYKYASHYTQTNEKMKLFANSLNLHGNALEKGLQLADCIYKYMTFEPGVTCTSTTAIEAFTNRHGVCQDYAHLFIALGRYLGLPARYANGFPVGNGESHAWIEVYSDGYWIGIDPSRNQLVGEDYVRFCIGRDFLDCALERGNFIGNVYQTQGTIAQVMEQ